VRVLAARSASRVRQQEAAEVTVGLADPAVALPGIIADRMTS
jgi:hypothetical protein